jgi:hypothetical protein
VSQPLLVPCPGCDTTYDVSQRTPGKRMRCPRCKGVVTVPERPAAVAAQPDVTASARIRRARGPACVNHPKRTSSGACAGCAGQVCEECWGPPSVEHLCARCVQERGLAGALPVDFGLLATPALAARALGQSVVRLLLWTLLSALATFVVFSIPIVLGYEAFKLTYDGGAGSWKSDIAAAIVFGSIGAAMIVHFLFLAPSGCAVFLDHALRGKRPPLGAALQEAWRRFLRAAPRLLGVLVVVLLLYLPYAILVFGAAWLLAGAGAKAPAVLALLLGLPLGLLPLLVALGPSVPIVILEERSVGSALSRSWELVRPHALSFAALVVCWFFLVAVLGSLFAVLGSATGLPAVFGVLSQLIDVLFWPALLVAAYHGLAAENAGVLGRR